MSQLYMVPKPIEAVCFMHATQSKDLSPLQNTQALSVHSTMIHNLCSMGLRHCDIKLGYVQFIHTLIFCKNLEKRHCYKLGYATIISHRMSLDRLWSHVLHSSSQVLINKTNTFTENLHLWTIHNIEIPALHIAIIPTKKTTYVCGVKVNEIMVTQNPQLAMVPAILVKGKIKPSHKVASLVYFSNEDNIIQKIIQLLHSKLIPFHSNILNGLVMNWK